MAVVALTRWMERTGDTKPDGVVTVLLGDKISRTFPQSTENALLADDTFLVPAELLTGDATVTITKTGRGTVRYGAALQYIAQSEKITPSGSGISITRRYYRPAATGRTALRDGDTLKPGETITVELTVTAQNDYSYVILEDLKPAGCEPTAVQSGFAWGDGLWATCEKRDTKTAFFTDRLPRGVHALSYELRAETPGVFHALPVNAYALYAPEIRATSGSATVGVAP